MLLDAAAAWRLDLRRSVMIGDQLTDMQAAAAAGVPNRILVPRDADEHAKALADAAPMMIAADLRQAADMLRDIVGQDR